MKTRLTLISIILLLAVACKPEGEKKNKVIEEDSNSGKACIEHIIAMDDSLGRKRNHDCEKVALSSSIQLYLDALNNLEDGSCPDNFNSAFSKHKDAWNNILVVTDNYPDIRGEMHVLFDEIAAGSDSILFDSLLKEIWNTWTEVENASAEANN